MTAPILHVLTNLELGGAQISVGDICMRLRERGFDMHIAYSSRGGLLPGGDAILLRRLAGSGVVLHDVATMRRAIHPVADLASGLHMYSLMRRLRPAIVHTHMSKAGVLGRFVAAKAGVPHVLHTVRGWSFYAARSRAAGRLAIAAERFAARYTTRAFAVSHSLARDGERCGVVVGRGYEIVRSGIDVAKFAAATRERSERRRELAIPDHAAVIGYVSAFTRAKGALDVPAILREVVRHRRDALLLVVGDGPLRSDLVAQCRRAGVAHHVRCTGRTADVQQAMSALDVLLVPSRWEGVPRVAVEALAAGVPVVATDVGGIREVIVEGETGYLAPLGDIAGLARGIVAALEDPGLRERLALRSTTVVAEHALDRTVAQHERVYRALLAGEDAA